MRASGVGEPSNDGHVLTIEPKRESRGCVPRRPQAASLSVSACILTKSSCFYSFWRVNPARKCGGSALAPVAEAARIVSEPSGGPARCPQESASAVGDGNDSHQASRRPPPPHPAAASPGPDNSKKRWGALHLHPVTARSAGTLHLDLITARGRGGRSRTAASDVITARSRQNPAGRIAP